MASIKKRNLLGIVVAVVFILLRMLLYYLNNTKGLVLINPYIYGFVDFGIILSPLIFIYEDKKIRNISYIAIIILVILNGLSIANLAKNTERIFMNSKNIKDDVIIEIVNQGVGSEIYVYERKYLIFSELKEVMYNEGEVAFNTRMKLTWVNDNLLSITYRDDNQVVEKIIYFGGPETRYENVLDHIEGTWVCSEGNKLIVSGNDVKYVSGGNTYTYSANYCDEQNNLSTILYGNYLKPSIAIVRENGDVVSVRKVSLDETDWVQYKGA
ncbi:hypothetical protein [uncultured Clostridium sp.]|uniref:hypothetical protein n=1 Tax=uncultured Clostridium sp. TaxID=59620 RepID=UPI00260CD896|nr:hypothetical protein [uncultured Clostridium sp.]